MITIKLTGRSLQELEVSIEDLSLVKDQVAEWAVNWLQKQGWIIVKPQNYESPKELTERLGISHMHLHRSLAHPNCPSVEIIRTQKDGAGRIKFVARHPVLDAFLLRNKPTLKKL